MKKALVTGGCGFIGSNLVKKLVSLGWQVDIVDDMSNGHLELLDGLNYRVLPSGSFYSALKKQYIERPQDLVIVVQDDFANENVLSEVYQENNFNVIFHMAALPRVSYSVDYPAHSGNVNIDKTVQLFEAARGSVDRIVWASSSSVYGNTINLPTRETEQKKYNSPYAWQKGSIEDFAKMCWDLYRLDIVCLRYFNVFGPGQYGDSPYSTAVSAWCHAIKHGEECRSDGDGEQTRDMCYIDNVVHANILAANSANKFRGEAYNIACRRKVSNNEILEHLRETFGDRVKVKHAPERAGDVKHTLADITKAYRDFDYEPLVHFWEGLEKTIEWWNLK